MPEKPINHVLAENLTYLMGMAKLSQAALALKAGVSQKTISNYLNPDQRIESSTGKQPSAKLAELEKIAEALELPVWRLVREMKPREQRLYDRIERAYEELRAPDAELAEEPDDAAIVKRVQDRSKSLTTVKVERKKQA